MEDNPWLTPLQTVFLHRFFDLEVSQAFFLTGGTALAAFYLHHRLSVDIDLFTLDDLALSEAARILPSLVAELGWDIRQARHTEYFHRYLLEDVEGGVLQTDLVRDFGPQFGERRQVGHIIVDSLENIAANKLTAILARSEPKDFVDLYFILHSGLSFEQVFEMGRQKDTGMTPFYLAGALLQVKRLPPLPPTTPPIDQEALETFFIELADRLIDQSRPTSRQEQNRE